MTRYVRQLVRLSGELLRRLSKQIQIEHSGHSILFAELLVVGYELFDGAVDIHLVVDVDLQRVFVVLEGVLVLDD